MIIGIIALFACAICVAITCVIFCMRKKEKDLVLESERHRQNVLVYGDSAAHTPRRSVKNFDVDTEKYKIINMTMTKIKKDIFLEERRRTYVQKNNQLVKNITKIFDDDCTICMETFTHGMEVMITPCKHCFHQSCLTNWINAQVEKTLKEEYKKIREGKTANLLKCGADCPNCNLKITHQPVVAEQDARNELDGILDMMASDSFMEEESLEPVGPGDVEIEMPPRVVQGDVNRASNVANIPTLNLRGL